MNQDQLRKLVASYQPDAAVLEHLGRLKLLMLVGPSGVGKSTLAKASGFTEVIGDASRLPRPGEQNGADYWFRTEAEMLAEARAGRYVQLAEGSEGDIKATHAGSFPDEGWAVFPVVASAVPAFRALPLAHTATAVIVPPDLNTWLQRLQDHHLTTEQLAPRFAEARQSYEQALHDQAAQFVLNDRVEAAVKRLHQVAAGEVPDGAAEARITAEAILQHIR